MTRLFFSAGEASGDMHGAHLIEALRTLKPDIQCEGLGGVRMQRAGMDLRFDLAGTAIMGFTEVVKHLPLMRNLFHETLRRIEECRPDAVVLIDYPGFHIRLAARIKALGVPVIYYISPQVWAWKKGRVRTLADSVTKMLVIFPFEKAIYDNAGLDCVFVGHPLMDHLGALEVEPLHEGELVIGVLPGSREQEIRRILPVLLDSARGIRKAYPEARFVAPCVDGARASQIQALSGDFPLETVEGGMYRVLDAARFCLVASGTATLETALFQVPMVVVYKVTGPTYWLARLLVRIEAISIVNILAGRLVVPEFIQYDARADRIVPVALDLIGDTAARQTMLNEFERVRASLGTQGASDRAAREILETIGSSPHG